MDPQNVHMYICTYLRMLCMYVCMYVMYHVNCIRIKYARQFSQILEENTRRSHEEYKRSKELSKKLEKKNRLQADRNGGDFSSSDIYITWICCSNSSSSSSNSNSDDDNNDDNDDYSGTGYEEVREGRRGQKGSERKEEGENMFDFHQTKLQYFYTHLNVCCGEMEVFFTQCYII